MMDTVNHQSIVERGNERSRREEEAQRMIVTRGVIVPLLASSVVCPVSFQHPSQVSQVSAMNGCGTAGLNVSPTHGSGCAMHEVCGATEPAVAVQPSGGKFSHNMQQPHMGNGPVHTGNSPTLWVLLSPGSSLTDIVSNWFAHLLLLSPPIAVVPSSSLPTKH